MIIFMKSGSKKKISKLITVAVNKKFTFRLRFYVRRPLRAGAKKDTITVTPCNSKYARHLKKRNGNVRTTKKRVLR